VTDSATVALSRDELVAQAAALGRALTPPRVVALSGEMGSGKTTFAQALCAGYGVEDAVTSPTFALVHEYRAPRSAVFHLDLYRLNGPADLVNIGWDDILSSGALVVVEWSERAGSRLPDDALRIHLAHDPDDRGRRLLRTEGVT
jgi:tRNA threonylcarbamoyladenosine biosynthesis protein TsaE